MAAATAAWGRTDAERVWPEVALYLLLGGALLLAAQARRFRPPNSR